MVLFQRSHLREKDDIADGFCSAEQHDQAVDAHAHASCGGHAVFEGSQEVFIDAVDFPFGVAAANFLGVKTCALFGRVIEFRVSWREFLPVDFEFLASTRRDCRQRLAGHRKAAGGDKVAESRVSIVLSKFHG